MIAFRPRRETLPPSQLALWPELGFARSMGFALYGGTAIALRLGHRESVDFDFFAGEVLDKDRITNETTLLRNGQVLQDSNDTLTFAVTRAGLPVKVSFFGDLVPKRIAGRVGEPETTDDGILVVAALEDLFATKVKVILDRAEAKDYRDVVALLRHGASLDRALASAVAIYGPAYQPADSLKALAYFEDGDLATLAEADKELLRRAAARVGALPQASIRSHELGAP